MTPPWPGMSAARILDPEAPLKRRFEEVAGLRRRPRSSEPEDHSGTTRRGPSRPARQQGPASAPQTMPTGAPDQVFDGETRGQSFGPPISRPPK